MTTASGTGGPWRPWQEAFDQGWAPAGQEGATNALKPAPARAFVRTLPLPLPLLALVTLMLAGCLAGSGDDDPIATDPYADAEAEIGEPLDDDGLVAGA